jgi:catechol 2,3-dioxygenase-like lactoylglutathione lyase family enzyme
MKRILIVSFALITFCTTAQEKKEVGFSNPVIEVVIVAKDVDKTLDFYTNILGMTKDFDFVVAKESAVRFGLTAKDEFKVHVLKINNEPHAGVIKVVGYQGTKQPRKSNYLRDHVGPQMLNFKVQSMEPYLVRIEGRSLKLYGSTPTPLKDSGQFVLIQDPNGIFIELISNE